MLTPPRILSAYAKLKGANLVHKIKTAPKDNQNPGIKILSGRTKITNKKAINNLSKRFSKKN